MSEDKSLEILKQAILLEKRGEAFYRTAAAQSGSDTVRDFFNTMADEETLHIRILSDQFKSYRQSGTFLPPQAEEEQAGTVASEVLSAGLKDKISAAGFESAAISAAMSMEERAVKLYSGRADTADSAEEKELYRWLAQWETGHLEALAAMDRTVTEQIWNDNSFWPF